MTQRLLTAAALLTVDASAAGLDFYQDVFPFLKANCVSCHNKTTTKAGLNMETPELMIQGGEAGPAIVPGRGAESLVVKASQHLDGPSRRAVPRALPGRDGNLVAAMRVARMITG